MSAGSGTPAGYRHVAIVGGGIAGLTTALALQEGAAAQGLPLRCTVLESDRRWGGKILTHRIGDLLIEAGPDSFLSQKPAALELCARLGLAERLIDTNEHMKQTFVYSRGRLRELPEGLVTIVPTKLGPFLRSGLLSWHGLARMGLDLVLPARSHGQDESLAGFFRRRLGREAFERLVEPLMAGIYAGDAEQMSLRATFPRFFELEQQYGSIIRGMLRARAQAASRPAHPGPVSDSPARRRHTMFVSLRGGMGELVEALQAHLEKLGVALRPSTPVAALRVRSSRPGAWTYDLILEEGRPIAADAVVLATPAFVSAELLRPLSPAAAGMLELIPYASTSTVSLAYRREAIESVPTGFGFVVPRAEGRELIAATWSSSKWPHRAPPSQVLVRTYLGGIGRERVLQLPDGELVRRVREELATITGLRAEPEYAQVTRWPRAMPQYTLGHLERLDAIQQALDRYPTLRLVGAGYRGLGIPDCIRDGTETASRLLQELTHAGEGEWAASRRVLPTSEP